MKINQILCNYIIIILISISIVIFNSYTKSKEIESFIPVINKIYRPHVRNIRIYVTETMSNMHKHAHVFLKRVGLQ